MTNTCENCDFYRELDETHQLCYKPRRSRAPENMVFQMEKRRMKGLMSESQVLTEVCVGVLPKPTRTRPRDTCRMWRNMEEEAVRKFEAQATYLKRELLK